MPKLLTNRARARRAQKRERWAFALMIAAGTGPKAERAQRLHLGTCVDVQNTRLG